MSAELSKAKAAYRGDRVWVTAARHVHQEVQPHPQKPLRSCRLCPAALELWRVCELHCTSNCERQRVASGGRLSTCYSTFVLYSLESSSQMKHSFTDETLFSAVTLKHSTFLWLELHLRTRNVCKAPTWTAGKHTPDTGQWGVSVFSRQTWNSEDCFSPSLLECTRLLLLFISFVFTRAPRSPPPLNEPLLVVQAALVKKKKKDSLLLNCLPG